MLEWKDMALHRSAFADLIAFQAKSQIFLPNLGCQVQTKIGLKFEGRSMQLLLWLEITSKLYTYSFSLIKILTINKEQFQHVHNYAPRIERYRDYKKEQKIKYIKN